MRTVALRKRGKQQISILMLGKAFSTVSHNILIDKLMNYRQDKWSVAHWLKCQAQRVVISDRKSSWREFTSRVPQGLILEPIQFNALGQRAASASLQMIQNGKE